MRSSQSTSVAGSSPRWAGDRPVDAAHAGGGAAGHDEQRGGVGETDEGLGIGAQRAEIEPEGCASPRSRRARRRCRDVGIAQSGPTRRRVDVVAGEEAGGDVDVGGDLGPEALLEEVDASGQARRIDGARRRRRRWCRRRATAAVRSGSSNRHGSPSMDHRRVVALSEFDDAVPLLVASRFLQRRQQALGVPRRGDDAGVDPGAAATGAVAEVEDELVLGVVDQDQVRARLARRRLRAGPGSWGWRARPPCPRGSPEPGLERRRSHGRASGFGGVAVRTLRGRARGGWPADLGARASTLTITLPEWTAGHGVERDRSRRRPRRSPAGRGRPP